MARLVRFGLVAAALIAGMASLPASAAFPGENGRIVFSSNLSGQFEIYSMNPDGSGVTQVTNVPPCSRGPSVSADGTKIVFHGAPTADCAVTSVQIYTVNTDGTGLTQLTNGGYNVTAAWNPDGSKIAFVSNRTGTCQIWTMNADGSNQAPLTHFAAQGVGGVSWSPDGSRIAYGTAVTAPQCPGPNGALGVGNLEIHVMDADGKNDTTLESESFIPGMTFDTSRHPDWSPDGSQITYASTASGDLQIWVMNADGSGQTQVTHDPNTPENFSRFSPDGTKLVFQAASTQGVEIRVVNVDGSHETKLIDGKFRNIQPSWGPLPEDD